MRNHRTVSFSYQRKMFRTVLLTVLVAESLGSALRDVRLLPDSQIVGGIQADISQHPYQLSLQTSSHICGGSIISSKWAVTAAHCVGSSPSLYTIRVGNTDKNRGTAYRVKRIIRHSSYNSRTIDFDIALLEIDGTISFNQNVQPISLASRELSPDTLVNVTGWGAIREGGSVSPNLMRVSVPIVSKSTCQQVYQSMNTVTDRMICAGYTAGGKDSCQGDSGGPLTSSGTLYGIVSWGRGCAQPKYPGVYSNVANLRSWIKTNSGV